MFVTGATGFIGKVVVEKLLRSCPDVRNVYLLCRAKRGTEPQARIDELMTREVPSPCSPLSHSRPNLRLLLHPPFRTAGILLRRGVAGVLGGDGASGVPQECT